MNQKGWRFFLLLFVSVSCYSKSEWPVFDHVVYTNPEQSTLVGTVAFTDCRVSDPTGVHFQMLQCGSLMVPENYAEPQGRQLRLFIGRMPASSGKDAGNGPFVPLSGGPGSASSEIYVFPGQGFDAIARQHDIFIIDQRGTGKSHRFSCAMESSALLSFDAAEANEVQQVLSNCRASFDGDPRFYTTSVAVKDLEAIRKALGVTQWNLYGVSYGTRVAQHYLRRFPDAVRSIILDGVVPPELALGGEIAVQSQWALEQMISRCEQSKPCATQFPNLRKGVTNLFSALKAPRQVSFDSFQTGQVEQLSFQYGHLAMLTRLSLYSSDSLAILPLLFHEAYAKDNFAPLARNATQIIKQMSDMIALGMHNSVVCSEDIPFVVLTDEQRKAAELSYLGTEMLDQMKKFCTDWPKGETDDDIKSALSSDKPSLLLSGGLDPITPPAYAERAARLLTNARRVTAPGMGHGLASKGCVPVLMAKFIRDIDPEGLQVDCVEHMQPDPFFIDFNGPAP